MKISVERIKQLREDLDRAAGVVSVNARLNRTHPRGIVYRELRELLDVYEATTCSWPCTWTLVEDTEREGLLPDYRTSCGTRKNVLARHCSSCGGKVEVVNDPQTHTL